MISLLRTQLLVSFSVNNLLKKGKRAKYLGLALLLVLCVAPGYGGYVASNNIIHGRLVRTVQSVLNMRTPAV